MILKLPNEVTQIINKLLLKQFIAMGDIFVYTRKVNVIWNYTVTIGLSSPILKYKSFIRCLPL